MHTLREGCFRLLGAGHTNIRLHRQSDARFSIYIDRAGFAELGPHHGASHHELSFYREAFANFYRCMENCVTTKVLRVRRRQSEIADLQRAVACLGADELLRHSGTQSLPIFPQLQMTPSSRIRSYNKRMPTWDETKRLRNIKIRLPWLRSSLRWTGRHLGRCPRSLRRGKNQLAGLA